MISIFHTAIKRILLLFLILYVTGCEWGIIKYSEQDGFEEDVVTEAEEGAEADIADDRVDRIDDFPPDDRVDPPLDEGMEVIPDVPEDITEMEQDLNVCTTEGELRCSADGAERCIGGSWVDIGPCPLGCNEATGNCYVPSNIPADSMDSSAGSIDLAGEAADIYFNTDTGEISDGIGNIVREAGTGYDAATGTTFTIIDQGAEAPQIGVFVVGGFSLPSGTTLYGEGLNALAIAASGTMVIDGIINVCASGQDPGPGGWAGGDAGAAGAGQCPGSPGGGGDSSCIDGIYNPQCSAGGGGGGYGGTGGKGGDSNVTMIFAGGDGGGPCGTPEISPLIGGSGGGGGAFASGNPSSSPGTGGGGGGAVQIVSALSVAFGDSGGIHSGGDGGGESDGGGGGGGGAGGGILIEAPDVDVASGVILAANGGGGGGGDCN